MPLLTDLLYEGVDEEREYLNLANSIYNQVLEGWREAQEVYNSGKDIFVQGLVRGTKNLENFEIYFSEIMEYLPRSIYTPETEWLRSYLERGNLSLKLLEERVGINEYRPDRGLAISVLTRKPAIATPVRTLERNRYVFVHEFMHMVNDLRVGDTLARGYVAAADDLRGYYNQPEELNSLYYEIINHMEQWAHRQVAMGDDTDFDVRDYLSTQMDHEQKYTWATLNPESRKRLKKRLGRYWISEIEPVLRN